MHVKLTLPLGSPGGKCDFTLTPVAPAPVVTDRGAIAPGQTVTGTLSAIDAIDTYDVASLAPRGASYSLDPAIVPEQSTFDVVLMRSDDQPVETIYGQSYASMYHSNYYYLNNKSAHRIAVAYAGPFNMANPNLHYSFTFVNHNNELAPQNILQLPQEPSSPFETQ